MVKNKSSSTASVPLPAKGEIRYEIECSHGGTLIEAPGITKVVAARGLKKPVVIVFVAVKYKDDFEKVVEGHSLVLGYKAYPYMSNSKPEVYSRA